MNKEFVKKMIKAKRLEYEAIKEIMPESIKNRIDSFQKDAFSLIKEVAIEIIKEDINHKNALKVNVIWIIKQMQIIKILKKLVWILIKEGVIKYENNIVYGKGWRW